MENLPDVGVGSDDELVERLARAAQLLANALFEADRQRERAHLLETRPLEAQVEAHAGERSELLTLAVVADEHDGHFARLDELHQLCHAAAVLVS